MEDIHSFGVMSLSARRPMYVLNIVFRTIVRFVTVLRGRTSTCITTAASAGTELVVSPVLPVAVCLCPNTRSSRSGSTVNRKYRPCTSYPTLPNSSTRPLRSTSRTSFPAATLPLRRTASSSTSTETPRVQSHGLCLNLRLGSRGPLSTGTPTTGSACSGGNAATGSSSLTGGSR